MGSKIGYPKKILNITQLDFDYEEVCTEYMKRSGVANFHALKWILFPRLFFLKLQIDQGHVLFNVMRMRQHEVWREIQKVFQPPPQEK